MYMYFLYDIDFYAVSLSRFSKEYIFLVVYCCTCERNEKKRNECVNSESHRNSNLATARNQTKEANKSDALCASRYATRNITQNIFFTRAYPYDIYDVQGFK